MATRPMSPSKRVDVGQIINPPFKVLMYGQPRGHKGLFTIGIPSAQRPNTDRIYLFDTVDSIIDKTTESEKEEVTLVIMLCDLNSTYNTHISVNVYNTYQQHVESGFIQIIHTQRSIYPDLEHVKPTFNDTKDRLKWRAKQNVDFSFLMHYSINISEYYIQLEDDVIVASDFVNSIKSHLSISTAWAVLEFSRLGFIGKMFKSSDLEYVASKLMLRYDEAPCDLLLSPIRMDLGQKKSIHSKQSLFQHIGRFSSLKNKLMPSIDNKFKDNANVTFDLYNYPAADDPEASFQTTFETYLNFTTEFAYDNNASSFFWGKTPKKGDTFTLVLAMPQNLTRIVVLTGKKETRNDNLLYTDLECSTFQFGSSETDECGTMFIKLTGLADGDADTLATGTAIPNNVKCLRLRVKRKLRTWVVIREILLYT
ncbi:MGT4C-like protein [Mya arenaria]|uniref:MGT4C-like protein n=2 Tax=Mya arenaria TaxID=6604 RepID=A0ABY7E3G4_MYAAR|nr:alpha-1,3-mannosyl-glycoprotein 4-beta-N-acetylglucosaminyltransferase C-like isoform X2 [Mya arenaria]WAR03357.1 MGT4C-like protein [Mya arenaria]